MRRVSRPGRRGMTPWAILIALVIAADKLSKFAVARAFSYGERMEVVRGFFDLTLVYNKGAAFSFLSTGSGWQRWFFTAIGIVAALFIGFMLARHSSQRLFCTALALIAGGALGNVVDRVLYGHVVDFIQVHWKSHYFPSFNVADSAITIGAALLILDELRRVRKSK